MAWNREKEKKAGKAMTIGSSIFGLVFAVFWCITAAAIGAGFMLIFGIPFVGMMIYRLYVVTQYAREDQQTPPVKEVEPWDRPDTPSQAGEKVEGFCPYCGGNIQNGFTFCPKCGRRQP